MAKKLYILKTQQVVTQIREYRFETDKAINNRREALQFVYNNGIEGSCLNLTNDVVRILELLEGVVVFPDEENA